MNLIDFLIIYTACGTPFGMYHFINHRKSDTHWLKSLLTVFVWIPYGFLLLKENLLPQFRNYSFANSASSEKNLKLLEKIKKDLERLLIEETEFFAVRDFREVSERYVGLTIAGKIKNQTPTEKEKNFYKISGSDSKIIGANCLHRRNLKLMAFHQSLAREDFLKFVSQYEMNVSRREVFYFLLLDFVKVLQDVEAEKALKEVFSFIRQSAENDSVINFGKEIWIQEKQNRASATPITSGLKTMKAPTSLPYKD